MHIPFALRFVLILAIAGAGCSKSNSPKSREKAIDDRAKEVYPQYIALDARERHFDETVWSKEKLAERCGLAFDDLWDSINLSTNKLQVLANFAVGVVVVPEFGAAEKLPHAIESFNTPKGSRRLNAIEWRGWLADLASAGWSLDQIEFRHIAFDPDQTPMTSEFYFAGVLSKSAEALVATLEGTLHVKWDPLPPGDGPPGVMEVDASRITVRTRRGELPFAKVIDETFIPREKSPFIDPLIVYDLDNDGKPEVILAAKNLVLELEDWKIKRQRPLCASDPGLIFSAVIADFNGDGFADYLCVKREGVLLFEGRGNGAFENPPRQVWKAPAPIRYALALTCGDVDNDGHLDLLLTQYKVPYLLGQVPTPYFNANDSYPAYLLRNNGDGSFNDITADSGLAPKRNRRTYSASFADLDGNGSLDLAVVNDFCGVDFYRNDGHGHFTDVTQEWGGETYVAGMADAFADFNRDGVLDFIAMGMTSPTVDRLEKLRLHRGDPKVDESKRAKLMIGNRLLLGKPGGGFDQSSGLTKSIARSGWSWGCGAADFDNDGFVDMYIANGHESKQSVRDYESQYWLHDLYVGDSHDSDVNAVYFAARGAATRARGYSFGGWERNRLFLNERGAKFTDVGPLLGVSLQQDSRNVVATDLDGDGRTDLLVTTFEAWPKPQQTLKIYRNTFADAGNWIGVRLRDQKNGVSAVGASVVLEAGGIKTIRQIVTGDSYRSQHPNIVHFGLGVRTKVDRIDVSWPNGKHVELREPAVNQYHLIEMPVAGK